MIYILLLVHLLQTTLFDENTFYMKVNIKKNALSKRPACKKSGLNLIIMKKPQGNCKAGTYFLMYFATYFKFKPRSNKFNICA